MPPAQPIAFAVHPWPGIRVHCATYAHLSAGTRAVLAIVNGVIDSGCADRLVAYTSVHDLVVTEAPQAPEAHPSYGLRVWDYVEVSTNGSFDRFAPPEDGLGPRVGIAC